MAGHRPVHRVGGSLYQRRPPLSARQPLLADVLAAPGPLRGVHRYPGDAQQANNCPSDFAKTPSLLGRSSVRHPLVGTGRQTGACFTVKVVLQAAFWDGSSRHSMNSRIFAAYPNACCGSEQQAARDQQVAPGRAYMGGCQPRSVRVCTDLCVRRGPRRAAASRATVLAVLAACGLLADGNRVLVHLAPRTKEDTARLPEVLPGPAQRGLPDRLAPRESKGPEKAGLGAISRGSVGTPASGGRYSRWHPQRVERFPPGTN
jgi:hypothetical protein